MVGLHHIVRPLTSLVVARNTVHLSPGAGGSARPVPPPAVKAIGETAASIAAIPNRSLLMRGVSPGHADKTSRYPAKNSRAKDSLPKPEPGRAPRTRSSL